MPAPDEIGAGGSAAHGLPDAPVRSVADIGRARNQARIALGILGAATLFAMVPFLPGLIGGPVLYVAGVPLHRWLAPKIGRRRSALVCAIVALVLVIVPIALLIASIVDRIPDTLRGIEGSESFRRLLALRVGSLDVGAHVRTYAASAIDWIPRQTPGWIGDLTLSTINLVVALFGFYYLLCAEDSSWRLARRVVPLPEHTTDLLVARFHVITTGVLLGVALTAILQGLVVGAAFALVGLPDPVFWGVITACVSVLPVLGSALVWLPGTVALALDQRYGAALALLLVGAVVASNIDNVAHLLVLKRVANIHPFVTLIGVFAGVNVFGLVGLLLGPLLLSFLIEFMRTYDRDLGLTPPDPA